MINSSYSFFNTHNAKGCIHIALALLIISGLCLEIIANSMPSALAFSNEASLVILSGVLALSLIFCRMVQQWSIQKPIAAAKEKQSKEAPPIPLQFNGKNGTPGPAYLGAEDGSHGDSHIFLFFSHSGRNIPENVTLVPASKTGSPWGIYALGPRFGLVAWNRDTNQLSSRVDELEKMGLKREELNQLLAKCESPLKHPYKLGIGRYRHSADVIVEELVVKYPVGKEVRDASQYLEETGYLTPRAPLEMILELQNSGLLFPSSTLSQ